jgi:hypothetical protein
LVRTAISYFPQLVSHLPTSLADSPRTAPTTNRTAVIAGTTAAVVVFLFVILAAVFAYRKHRLRKNLAIFGKKKEGRGLLDGEDFDDDVNLPNMASYRDREVSMGSSMSVPRSTSPTPSLLKSRTAETGSIFREEVWPPPGFIDPISKNSSRVNLSKIVDDVMGPSSLPLRPGLPESGNSGLHGRTLINATSTSGHSHFSSASTSSGSAFLASGNVHSPMPPISQHTDHFSSAPERLSASFLPPGASLPRTPGMSSPQIPPSSHSPSYSNLSYPLPSLKKDASPKLQIKPATQPKKSSPLARALTGDAKIWLGRTVQRGDS